MDIVRLCATRMTEKKTPSFNFELRTNKFPFFKNMIDYHHFILQSSSSVKLVGAIIEIP